MEGVKNGREGGYLKLFCSFALPMKTVRAIVTTLIWTLAGCYLLPAILLHIPAIQEMVGEKVAEVVAETLKTNVRVGRVDVGFFNRLVVDDLRIDDQQRQPMIQASRVAAKVDLVSLFQGKVRISSAQLFGLDARLYQKDAHTPPNFQFALDALSDKDNKEPSHIDLAIQSLVVRNGSVRYDQLWQPRKAGLSPSHLHLSQLSGHFVLHSLTPDGLKADIKNSLSASKVVCKSMRSRSISRPTSARLASATCRCACPIRSWWFQKWLCPTVWPKVPSTGARPRGVLA